MCKKNAFNSFNFIKNSKSKNRHVLSKKQKSSNEIFVRLNFTIYSVNYEFYRR